MNHDDSLFKPVFLLVEDPSSRLHISVGMVAVVLLIPLAIPSTRLARRLFKKIGNACIV